MLQENGVRHELVVVTGKGGVGKTVIAAALGLLFARTGRRVALLESDPRENLHHLLGVAPSGGAIVSAGPRLLLQNVQPQQLIAEFTRAKLRVAALAKRVTAHPVFQHFADAAPGLKEMALVGHALRLVEGDVGPEVDVAILDAPATGHGISLLAAPLLVSEVIGTGPLGRLARDVAHFVADPERCGVVVVTRAEELPVLEALETIAAMEERLGRPPALVVVNALYPPLPADGLVAGDGLAEALELWTRRRQANERERERLAGRWHGPTLEVPFLPLAFGPPLAEALADSLAEAFGYAEAAE